MDYYSLQHNLMNVDVSGQKLVFPSRCACCNRPADTTLSATASRTTGKRVVHTQTKGWNIPYCIACQTHVSAWNASIYPGITLGILGIIVAIITQDVVGMIILVACGVLGTVVVQNARKKIRAQCSSTCTAPNMSVQYLGWSGSGLPPAEWTPQ
jgi:hypothetical protein